MLIKIAESENEDNIMYLLLPASAHEVNISHDGTIFLVLPLMVKLLVAEAVISEYLPVNQALERRAV